MEREFAMTFLGKPVEAASEKRWELSARLVIYGFECAPEEITRVLGINPDETWRKGDLRGERPVKPSGDSGWVIASSSSDRVRLEPHIVSVLEKVSSVDRLRDLPPESKRYLSCEVTTLEGTSGPDITISPTILSRLAEIGAELSIDSYFLGSDD